MSNSEELQLHHGAILPRRAQTTTVMRLPVSLRPKQGVPDRQDPMVAGLIVLADVGLHGGLEQERPRRVPGEDADDVQGDALRGLLRRPNSARRQYEARRVSERHQALPRRRQARRANTLSRVPENDISELQDTLSRLQRTFGLCSSRGQRQRGEGGNQAGQLLPGRPRGWPVVDG